MQLVILAITCRVERSSNSTAPGGSIRRGVRPPIAPDSAPPPGAVDSRRLRRTVRPRRIVHPAVWDSAEAGYPASSVYVRTFWTALLGPGAVADLLRLATAASRGRSLLRPVNLSMLCAAGLARDRGGSLEIRVIVPQLTVHQLRSLPPAVRRLHAEHRWSHELNEPARPAAARTR